MLVIGMSLSDSKILMRNPGIRISVRSFSHLTAGASKHSGTTPGTNTITCCHSVSCKRSITSANRTLWQFQCQARIYCTIAYPYTKSSPTTSISYRAYDLVYRLCSVRIQTYRCRRPCVTAERPCSGDRTHEQ